MRSIQPNSSTPPRRPGFGWFMVWLLLPSPLGVWPAIATPAIDLEQTDYVVTRWETADGLPENSATALAQTPDAYLWIGTFNGLLRFNGSTFTLFHPRNTPELPSTGIVNLHADRTGRLWVSTYAGLVSRTGTAWQRWQAPEGWTGNLVRSFAERPNGDLLVTTFNGRLFEFSNGRFLELPAPHGESGQGYFGCVDETGHWWAVQNRFIGRFEDGRWVSMLPPPPIARDHVGCTSSRDGGIWLLLGRELRKFRNGLEVQRTELPEQPGGVWSVTEDRNGNIWIAAYNGSFCRLTPEGIFERWSEGPHWPDNGRCIFEDHEGNLWLGTSGDGLLRLTPRRFQHFDLVGDRRGAIVQSLTADPTGRIWAATYGHGLFSIDDGAVQPFQWPGLATPSPYLQSVLADASGRLYVGTFGDGLRLVQAGTTQSITPQLTGGGNPISLFQDSKNRIWTSSGHTKIGRFDGQSWQVLGPADGVPRGAVISLTEDATGMIWLANEHGLFRRSEALPFTEVFDSANLPIAGITCLHPDTDGSLWLGSLDQGLWHWQSGQLTKLAQITDLPAVPVQSLIHDAEGHLWMTSGHQLLRAPLAELQAAVNGRTTRISHQWFDASDGLPNAAFTTGRQPACARDPAGRLWFPTIKGVVMVDPRRLRLNPHPPPIHIEAISYFKRAKRPGSVPDDRERSDENQIVLSGPFHTSVSLPPGCQRIEITYAGLSYAAPAKVRYQVMLEGSDFAWHDSSGRRTAQFYDLKPGAYVFRVRATNHDGVWNQTGASLAFSVAPYFWQTVWFRIGAGLSLILLGGAISWRRARTHIRRALERERAAHEIRALAGRLINAQEEERRRIARELHDHFSQSLALLSVEMELLGASRPPNQPHDPNPFGQMANRVKELSSEVHRLAHELHPAKLDQLGLEAAARSFCRELTRQSGLNITFESNALPAPLPAEVAVCLYRILQESLHNVVRHSGAPAARVQLRADARQLRLVVADQGRGFELAQASRAGGLGLSSMQERVRLLHGTLNLDSDPGQGTRIEVTLPMPQPIPFA